MKGNAAVILIFVWLVASAPPALSQQGGGFILQTFVTPSPRQTPSSSTLEPATGDLLEFTDGAILHGELKRMDTGSGLLWDDPTAKHPIDFGPNHIASIQFSHANPVSLAPKARLRLANGDDLLGTVTSLDDSRLGFSTWFGKTNLIARDAVQSITFLSSNYTILYEGPADAEGWVIGSHNPESWTLRDGTFSSDSSGTLGRDFDLTGSSTIEFDLAWSGPLEFLVYLYSDAANHAEDFGNSYVLEFQHNQAVSQATLRYLALAAATPFRAFGSAPLSLPPKKSKVHVTIQSNKEEGTVAVYVDTVLVKRWKDEAGFSASGGGVIFQQVSMSINMSNAKVDLSNIRVSQWQGRNEPEAAAVATNTDVVRFMNHDKVTAKIAGISGEKITLALDDTLLQIPISRVTQINFAATAVAMGTRSPWDVRAHFPHGGSISFQLEKWDDKQVTGRSPIFGALAFQPGQIRQLEFNLDHAKAMPPPPPSGEFGGFDE